VHIVTRPFCHTSLYNHPSPQKKKTTLRNPSSYTSSPVRHVDNDYKRLKIIVLGSPPMAQSSYQFTRKPKIWLRKMKRKATKKHRLQGGIKRPHFCFRKESRLLKEAVHLTDINDNYVCYTIYSPGSIRYIRSNK
jgi:hypothetical protein